MPYQSHPPWFDHCNYTWRRVSPWPPLWSIGQSSWLQIQRSRVQLPALSDFLRGSGSGKGFTQPREDNWGAVSRNWLLRSRKARLTARGDSLRWPRDTLYPQSLTLTSPTSCGRSGGIVRLRTTGHLVCFFLFEESQPMRKITVTFMPCKLSLLSKFFSQIFVYLACYMPSSWKYMKSSLSFVQKSLFTYFIDITLVLWSHRTSC
jgi:hypothetical protein